MIRCQLDIFPVELVHHLLSYFSANEIFCTFTDVSSYINNVLLTYSYYCMNLKSVTKSEFDSVCELIKPDQVISLTLCDNENTPGQTELFLSRFQINQFTRLRSLTLIDIGPDYWESIVTKLIELKNLRSFIFNSSTRTDSWISTISGDDLTKLDRCLFDSYGPMLHQLNRLKLSHGDFLKSVEFPYLHHLIVERCSADIIKHICCVTPQLKSLVTGFRHGKSTTGFVFPFAQLSRLVLQISGSTVSMSDMERLISNLPSLKNLELCANGSSDLVDGQRWQTATTRLVTFNFNFSLLNDLESTDLDSFRTPYWLNERRWFVAFSDGSLYSVPHFAATETDANYQSPAISTMSDSTMLNQYITSLTLSDESVDIKHPFTHVERLTVYSTPLLTSIERIVDLSRIHDLTLVSSSMHCGIMFLIDQLPNLQRLFIKCQVKHFLEQVKGKTLEKIRKLELGNAYIREDEEDDYNMQELCSVFPRIEQLRVDYLCSIAEILGFIHQFKHLSTASFHYTSWSPREEPAAKNRDEIQLILNQKRHSQKANYTYRFDNSSLHFWIGEQLN